MANNLVNVVPILVAQGLETLRSACVMPRLVNSDYSNDPANQGDTVNLWIPSAQAVSDVSPSATPVQGADSAPVRMPIPLNKWRRSGFYLTDKQQLEIVGGVQSKETAECVKAIAQDINAFILAQAYAIYNIVGTPGTTPFASDVSAATNARKLLNNSLAPMDNRRIVLDVNAEAQALNLPVLTTFQNVGQTAGQAGIIEGSIGRKLGFDWSMDQQIPTQATSISAGAVTVNGSQAAGNGSLDGGRTGTLSIAKATNNLSVLAGDKFTIAGDPTQYVVLAPATVVAAGTGSISIAPALVNAAAGSAAITFLAQHVENLAFHRDCFAFVSRPLQAVSANSMEMLSIPDPISGITLRLEVSRQNKQHFFDFDVLYGAACVRPELGCIIAG